MKIIKRSGTEAAFDLTKIISAVSRANHDTDEAHRLPADRIRELAIAVEHDCQAMNRAPSVEEIQELVETKLMEFGAFEVAKQYIRYRYTRSLVRKSNTTDNRILSLIECNNEEVKQENSNKNPAVNTRAARLHGRRGQQGHHPPPAAAAATSSRRTSRASSTSTTRTTMRSTCTTATW